MTAKLPERIYLQWHKGVEVFTDEGVTCCVEQVNEDDGIYVLEARAEAAEAKVKNADVALQHCKDLEGRLDTAKKQLAKAQKRAEEAELGMHIYSKQLDENAMTIRRLREERDVAQQRIDQLTYPKS